MDAPGVQGDINPSSSIKAKTITPTIKNSPEIIQPLSPISFWDSLDTPIDFGATNKPRSAVLSSTTRGRKAGLTSAVLTANDSLGKQSKDVKPPKPSPQVVHVPERKRLKSSSTLSALDSADYWLRFDSDDDEPLGRASEVDTQTPLPKRRPLSLLSSTPGNALVGSSGNLKLASPEESDRPIDDSALEHALSDEDDTFSLNLDREIMRRSSSQPDTLAPERLYSTPLSWEPPQPALPMDPYYGMNQPLSDLERQRLLAIAMGTGLAPGAVRDQTAFSMDFDFDVHQSPTAYDDARSSGSEHKRKGSRSKPTRSGQTTPTEPAEKSKDKTRTSERAAHNDIERKYRTNLKDRIAELREAIPSLKSIPEGDDEEGDSPLMQSRAPKVSKGTVLTKATEYIHHLERRNRSVTQKNEELIRRLQAFEQLLGAGPVPTTWQNQGYGGPVFHHNPRGFPS